MASKQEKGTKPQVKKSHVARNIGLVILLVIIATLGYLYLQYGTIANVAFSAVTSGKPLNQQAFESAVIQKLDSENVGANYTGHITINSDPAMSLRFGDAFGQIYYELKIQNLSGFGSPDMAYFSNPSGYQSGYSFCVQGSPLLASTIINGYNLSGSSIRCYLNSGDNLTQSINFLNAFVLFPSASNVSTTSVGLSSYYGTPCYIYAGTGNIWINSTMVGSKSAKYIPATMKFNTCFSSKYLLPLTLTANFTAQNGATVNVFLNTTGIVLNFTQEDFNITTIGST